MNFKEILPTNAVMFTMIFGDERHPKILIHFLNSVIKPASPIKKVHIRKKHEPNQDHISDKGVRLDIVADTDTEIINIEMQLTDEKNITDRALFYWSRLFAGQLVVGQKFHELKRTVSINVLDFTYFKDDDRFWRKGYLSDENNGEKFTDRLEMHFIEIGKMREMKKDSPITFWIEFFKNPYSGSVKSLCEFVPEIKEAKAVYERSKSDPIAQERIRIHEKAIIDRAAAIATAKDEGRNEEKIAIAKSMLKDGANLSIIVKYTGLTERQIRELK